jgi:hypothetical protein
LSQRSNRFGLACSIFLVVMLALPSIQWATRLLPEGGLYGYTDAIPGPPIKPVRAFFNKTLQPWVKEYFDVNVGFRPFFVRTFNEITFRLFRETNRMRMVKSEHGLHSHLSINYLNEELTNRANLEARYRGEALKLLRAQRLLETRGKYFEVVIASSRSYVYPEELGSRYLAGSSAGIFSRVVSFGEALKAAGVNVTDSGPELRRLAGESGMQTHAAAGLHWNFFVGCMMARRVLQNARESRFPATPDLDCGTPRLEYALDAIDHDGLSLLNIWSDGGLLAKSPYPSIVPIKESAWRPSIVFIGDSFSYQMRLALQQGGVYSKLAMSSYFALRQVDGPAVVDEKPSSASVRDQLMSDVLASDIIIVEMVDYNVARYGYGFADYVIDKLE